VNLYRAEVGEMDGMMRAVAGPIVTDAPRTDGAIHLMLHPDEVVLLPSDSADKAGHLRGEVVGLTDEGNYVAVQLRVAGLPTPLTAYVSRHSVRSHMVELGTFVIADVERAIHVLCE